MELLDGSSTRSRSNGNQARSIKLRIITLEVHYTATGGLALAKPYLREPIRLDDDNNHLCFRAFLRRSLYQVAPALKYRDEEVFVYQTKHGTNLLNILDQPIDCLPELLDTNETAVLQILIQRTEQPTSKSSITSPVWPKTVLDDVHEHSIPNVWKAHVWTEVYERVGKKEKRRWWIKVLVAVGVVCILLIVAAVLAVVLTRNNDAIDDKSSLMPTPSPTNRRFTPSPVSTPVVDQRVPFLLDLVLPITDELALQNPASPQSQAVFWLASTDGADLGGELLALLGVGEEVEQGSNDDDGFRVRRRRRVQGEEGPVQQDETVGSIIDREIVNLERRILRRYALVVQYIASSPPPPPSAADESGEQQTDEEGFRDDDGLRKLQRTRELYSYSSQHECSWHAAIPGMGLQGIICHKEDGSIVLDDFNTNEDEAGYIILNLTDPVFFDIGGFLPPEIGSLTELKHLRIHSQNFTNSIPASIGLLSNLQTLSLIDNTFSGRIPRSIGQLSNLEQLWLADNFLSGSIPDELGSDGLLLTNLKSLSLGGNYLEGTIPSTIANLSNLSFLHLQGSNDLSGTLPASTSLSTLTLLTVLVLEQNHRLNGTIDVLLAELDNLSTLMLRKNAFTATIPVALFGANSPAGGPSIVAEDLSSNNFEGSTVPETFGLLDIEYFAVARNKNLEGNLTFLCSSSNDGRTLIADCSTSICDCCTSCCSSDDDSCEEAQHPGWSQQGDGL